MVDLLVAPYIMSKVKETMSLFDAGLLLNNTWPELTQCFQITLSVWVPGGWLWLTLPVFLRYLFMIPHRYPLSKLCAAKMTTCCLLLILTVCRLVLGHFQSSGFTQSPAFYSGHGVRIVTLCLALYLTIMSRRKGLYSPCLLFIFWFFWLFLDIIPFYSLAVTWSEHEVWELALFYLQYMVLLCQFVLGCFSDSKGIVSEHVPEEKRLPCPEITASFPSKVTFNWMHQIIWTGWRRNLLEEDLWDVPPHIKCKVLVPRFYKRLKKYFHTRTQVSQTSKENYNSSTEKQNLLEMSQIKSGKDADNLPDVIVKDNSQKECEKAESKPTFNLIKAIFMTYYNDLWRAHTFKLMTVLLRYINPLLLKLMIEFIETKQETTMWRGYGLAVCMFLTSVTVSILEAQCFYTTHNMAVKIRTGLVAAVYRKSLTMNNEARKDFTTGAIVNHMSVDCNRIEGCISTLHNMWSAPLSMVLSFYFLYEVLGIALVAGVVVMVIMAPLNAKLVFYMKRLHNEQLTIKDERLKNMNEILNGIKVLKLYAWESSFFKKVMAIRSKEIALLKKLAVVNATNVFCWAGAPILVTLSSFVMYVLMSEHHFLDPQTAFVALALFNILREPMNMFPNTLSTIAQALVSLRRLATYLSGQDLNPDMVKTIKKKDTVLSVKHGQFSWDKGSDRVLKNINFKVQRGQLVAIVGSVGAGKSSLLSAVLGEMEKVHGEVKRKGSVAYVPQQAWMQNLSLRKNILFGSGYEEKKYKTVINACALEADLEMLPGGENTEIGEKGINLSGGQKQRVSLARAVYSDKDIYLMDDPLSAVDSHVGKHIFKYVISNEGLLKNKTRVLVTHGVHWLPMVDMIVVINQGEISEVGSYEELLNHDGQFAQFLKEYLKEQEADVFGGDEELEDIRNQIQERVDSVGSLGKSPRSVNISPVASSLMSHSVTSLPTSIPEREFNLNRSMSLLNAGAEDEVEDDDLEEEHRITDDEKNEIGRVKLSVLKIYFLSLGVPAAISILSLFIIFHLTGVLSNVWLSIWTEEPRLKNASMTPSNSSDSQELEALSYYYLGIYCMLATAQAVLVMLYVMLTYWKMVRAASSMHKGLLDNILHQAMSFFDTTPTGRILNRFTRDVDIVDNAIPRITRQWLTTLFNVFVVLIVIAYSTPIFLAAAIPTLFVYLFVQRLYIPTSRQMRRYHSTTRSPIYSHFTETITGASSIRAYDSVERFCEESLKRVDRNNIFHYAALASLRWMKMRLEFLGNVIILSAAIFAVVTPGLSGGVVGLSISYALQMTGNLISLVQVTTDLETNVVSVERIVEYSAIPREAEWTVTDKKPPADWPTAGNIKIDDLQVRYRPDLDLVLKGISCSIKPGEKIGVVGRTGAGKSSLTMALFRIVETAGGKILIDGYNIAEMGLHDLRASLTILPQDPVLFSGTMRLNLDPFGEHTDPDIWTALERAHLKEFVSGLPTALDHECDEGGGNLSVGQRQLVCLARSLLKKTKILVLDEATAAVDLETDELIQKTIRTAFHDCTVITIAHRLNTIMDYDRIMVLSAGQIAEFDSPSTLLEDRAGMFYGLAKDANLVS